MAVLGAVVVLLTWGSFVSALSRTLADCQAVAREFGNTCSSGPVANILTAPGEVVACAGVEGCAGSLVGNVCRWTRRVCVTCREVSGTVRMRIQSNGLPRHCYSSPSHAPAREQNYDFEVDFNPPVTNPANNPSTQAEVNALLCDIQRHSTVPAASRFVQYGSTEMRTVVGVSVTGNVIMNPISVDGVDPFYPAAYGRVTNPSAVVERVDVCLGHPQGQGVYHYHMLSPCAVDEGAARVLPCNARNGCGDFVEQAMASYSTKARKLTVLGVAKDGHVIYGPYLDNGEEVEQGLDVCNGATGLTGCDDSYAYFATRRFPYFSGCFGGGNRPRFLPQCTANRPLPYTTRSNPCTPTSPSVPTTPAPPTPAPTRRRRRRWLSVEEKAMGNTKQTSSASGAFLGGVVALFAVAGVVVVVARRTKGGTVEDKTQC